METLAIGDHLMSGQSGYPENVVTCLDGFESRRQRCLNAVAGFSYPPRSIYGTHIYGIRAIANLALDRDHASANAELREVAAWFQLPHPTGRDHLGECDFVAMKLCLAYHHPAIKRHLEAETLAAIRRFFLAERFDSKYGSENHALIFHVSRHLMAQALPEENFTRYGARGISLCGEDRDWLADFLRFRAERGWGEFDSACYLVPDWEALTCLHDYTGDAELRRLTGMMLDLLLADMAVDSLNGMYGGAHGRIYTPQALDHVHESTYPLQYLYFGLGDPACAHKCLIDALLADYRPHPLVVDIALNRPAAYGNRERKHLHKMSDTRPSHPLDGSIRKYTWYTPEYILGCVQYQDPYPEDTCGDRWYAHHQQHQWDLTFGTRTDARLFTHHPGDFNEHNYWTGDLRCGCGLFFQHLNVVLALYDIPAGQPYQFIHAYVPRAAFDELREDGCTLCVRVGSVYAALVFIDGYEWVREGEYAEREVISRSARTGAVCEVGTAGEFDGFSAFCAEMFASRRELDRDSMSLTYHSRRCGAITLDRSGRREVCGQPADLDYPTYDCPYLRSAWKSGVVELLQGERRLLLDFRSAIREGT